MSGYPLPAAEAVRALPAASLLAKPFAREELRRQLEDMLDQSYSPATAVARDARAS